MSSTPSRRDRHHLTAVTALTGVVALLAGGGATPPALAVGDGDTLDVRTIALTGQPAPGAEDGIVFSSFTTPLNHSIMRPLVDAGGTVAFIAFIAGPGVGDGNQTGIWSDASEQLQLVARNGSPAPGAGPGVVFDGIPSEYLPFPPSYAGGLVGLQGFLAGPGVEPSNDGGVWRGDAAALDLVAREGDQAAGLDAGLVYSSVFGAMAGSGTIVLSASVNGPGVTADSDEGRWSDLDGTMSLIVREGDPAPGTPPGVVIGRGVFGTPSTFPETAVSSTGAVTIAANLFGTGVDEFSDEALFRQDAGDGALHLLLREGDPAPGMPQGVTIGGNSVLANFRFISMNGSGQVAFTCRLGGSISTTTAMYSDRTGTLEPVVTPGEDAPGGDFPFGVFGAPALNDAGQIAFTLVIPDGDNDPFTNLFGLWSDVDGQLGPVVLPDDEVPAAGADATLTNVGSLVGFDASGTLAFTAGLDRPENGVASTLLLRAPDGELAVVATVGDPFDVSGDGSDAREVLRIVPGGLSAGGEVAFRLDFTDGSSGHFVAAMGGGGSTCPSDVTGDGVTDVTDLVAVIMAWGTDDSGADANGDGTVDVLDLAEVILGWGACP